MHVTYANVDSSLVTTLDHDIVITDIGNDQCLGCPVDSYFPREI